MLGEGALPRRRETGNAKFGWRANWNGQERREGREHGRGDVLVFGVVMLWWEEMALGRMEQFSQWALDRLGSTWLFVLPSRIRPAGAIGWSRVCDPLAVQSSGRATTDVNRAGQGRSGQARMAV